MNEQPKHTKPIEVKDETFYEKFYKNDQVMKRLLQLNSTLDLIEIDQKLKVLGK